MFVFQFFWDFIAKRATAAAPFGGTDYVPLIRNGATYKVNPGILAAGLGTGVLYRVSFSAPQTAAYSASQVLGSHPFATGVSFPANFGSYAGNSTLARSSATVTGSTTVSVQKSLSASPLSFSEVGTVVFGAGGAVSTALTTSGGAVLNFAAGDTIKVVAPSSPDATFAGFSIVMIGSQI